MQFKFSALMFFAVVAVVNLSSCGTMERVQSTATAKMDADATSRLVTGRAQQRWNALLKREMDVAYQLISPAGRSLMTVEDYRPRVITGFWRGAKVTQADCSAEICEVTVLVDMVVERVKFTNPVKETWILDAGKWWFVYQG